jgi:hypothetical protein
MFLSFFFIDDPLERRLPAAQPGLEGRLPVSCAVDCRHGWSANSHSQSFLERRLPNNRGGLVVRHPNPRFFFIFFNIFIRASTPKKTNGFGGSTPKPLGGKKIGGLDVPGRPRRLGVD